ncbi:hypothetical protein ACTUM0_08210 [Schaalia turicensis]|uniref:hypothetical protein n=1 Tax=Schaalia turicensis TaxID=131111 RepID=UPI003FA41DBE
MTAVMYASLGALNLRLETPGEAMVLARLVWHADQSGGVIITYGELGEQAMMSPQAARECVANLIGESVCVCDEPVRGASEQGARQIQIAQHIVARLALTRVPVVNSVSTSTLNTDESADNTGNAVFTGFAGNDGKDGNGGIGIDPLSARGLLALLEACVKSGWADNASRGLAVACEVEVDARLGWIVRRRSHLSRVEAREDLISRLWSVLREHTQQVLSAESNPWGLAVSIVVRQVSHADEMFLRELAVDMIGELGDFRAVGTDDVRPVDQVSFVDLTELFSRGHHHLIAELASRGVGQGLAWQATRRMVEIAATTDRSRQIKVARSDEYLASLALPPHVISAWMSLICGTRRGGVDSSFVLRIMRGGTGVEPHESKWLATIENWAFEQGLRGGESKAVSA